MAEWKDFGEELKKSIVKTKRGIHIPNDKIKHLSDELDDVKDQYDDLEGGKWDKAYEAAWKKATTSKEAGALGRRAKAFKMSKEGKMLKKEICELKKSIKKNVKISDVEKDSDDEDEENLDDIEELLNMKKKDDKKKKSKKSKKSKKDDEEEDEDEDEEEELYLY